MTVKDQGIKNIIFDFGGVLIDLHRNECIARFEQLGFKGVEYLISNTHQLGPFNQFELGDLSTDDFYQVIKTYLIEGVTNEDIDEAWLSILGEIPEYKLQKILALKDDYRVFCLSNTNKIHWDWSCDHAFNYQDYKVEDYFEKIFLSYEMHMAKPDSAAFQYVLHEAGIQPEETLLIDDSVKNIEAASQMGMHTHLYVPGEDWRLLFD